MSSKISAFWLSNPDYWITNGQKQKIVDKLIYEQFHDYDFTQENDLGKIIYLDQFIRHFSRMEPISEAFVTKCRLAAADIATAIEKTQLLQASSQELIWYLMPWKHLQLWAPIFTTINQWLRRSSITEHPELNRFFMDTYRKAYSEQAIADKIVNYKEPEPYNSQLICDFHPPLYASDASWIAAPLPTNAGPLVKALSYLKEPVTVSLSGGIDSMLMTALLVRSKVDVIATHIVYGNRMESHEERKFITTYCSNLGIPLYVYSIEWLRRDQVDRAFYETMTRLIRFNVYKALKRPVLLGHIQEDMIENIWTNLAHGTNLEHLAKFNPTCIENGVTVMRPWLQIKKSTIYDTAHAISIPYLKNSTPSWSNRGKFREKFHIAVKEQYGTSVDDKMIEVANRYKNQNELLDRLLYQKIRTSWDSKTRQIEITEAIAIELDSSGWQQIFTELAHAKLKIKKPSYVACEDFKNRMLKGFYNGQKISLSKVYTVEIIKKDERTWLKV